MSLLPEKLPESVDNVISNVTDKPAKEIGDIFNDILYLVFGGIHFLAEKIRIKFKYSLEKFEKTCKQKIEAIPLENRVEPNTQIVFQALEDSKYCIEDEEIREMFANLIASTMDSRVSKTVHPSFSSILKQMTSEDAKFLMKFNDTNRLPVCNIKEDHKGKDAFNILFNDLYVEQVDHFEQTICENAFIISTLQRLGLIQVTYLSYISEESDYDVFRESLFFKGFAESEERNPNITITLEKGLMELTHLGKNFLRTCCPPKLIVSVVADNHSNNV